MANDEEVPETRGLLPCIVCGFEPEPVFPDEPTMQPYEATMFTSRGHYGSTVFDPMSRYRTLSINICDNCLKERKDCVRLVIETPRASSLEILPWNPEEEY